MKEVKNLGSCFFLAQKLGSQSKEMRRAGTLMIMTSNTSTIFQTTTTMITWINSRSVNRSTGLSKVKSENLRTNRHVDPAGPTPQ